MGRFLPAHALASLLCLSILAITVFEKFTEGGWVTIIVTAGLTGFCFVVKRHYERVATAIRPFDNELPCPEESPELFVAGQLSFEEDSLWNRIMHNETALGVHRRLHHNGLPMSVLPVRIKLAQSAA